MLLTDDQWILIEGLVLESNSTSKRHPTSPERERFILECILWKLATGVPWYDLPDVYLKAIHKPSITTTDSGSINDSQCCDNIFPDPVNFPIPSHQTIYRRYLKWLKAGIINQVIALLTNDLKTRGGFDLIHELTDGDIQFERSSNLFNQHPGKLFPHSRGKSWKVTLESKNISSWQHRTALFLLCIVARQLKISIDH